MTNKQIIIIVSIVVVILLVAFYLTYRAGKKMTDPNKVKIGSDEAGTTALTQQEVDSLKALALSIHSDMDGLNWKGWNNSLYEKAGLLSDTELVALSNIFNTLYENESGQTFLQWLNAENFSYGSVEFGIQIESLKARLVNLGIS